MRRVIERKQRARTLLRQIHKRFANRDAKQGQTPFDAAFRAIYVTVGTCAVLVLNLFLVPTLARLKTEVAGMTHGVVWIPSWDVHHPSSQVIWSLYIAQFGLALVIGYGLAAFARDCARHEFP